jgi:SsrA-binding protein
MAKKKAQPKRITNRRASYDYELGDSLIVGIELTGAEAKSLRMGNGNLRGAYVTIKDTELFLINATITGNSGIVINEQNKTRARKLLAKRKQIDSLIAAKSQGITIVPLELITGGHYIKLRIAIGKGKKRYDKRQVIKKREAQRQADTESKMRS